MIERINQISLPRDVVCVLLFASWIIVMNNSDCRRAKSMALSSKLVVQLSSRAWDFINISGQIENIERGRLVIFNKTPGMPESSTEKVYMDKDSQGKNPSSNLPQQKTSNESEKTDGVLPRGVTVGEFSLLLRRDSQSNWNNITDRYLNLHFEGIEWDKLFFDVLRCPTRESIPEVSGEDIVAWDERYKEAFQNSIPEYPMLAKIWDMYVDSSYSLEELEQLRNECLNVKEITKDSLAIKGLNKLIQACDEGLKEGLGLYLAAD